MSVHLELAQHAKNQNAMYNRFLELDQQRELYIEEAITLCKQGKFFSTEKINAVTREINKINLRFIPTRQLVTPEMVQEYVMGMAN
ncbi:MAG TPA: DUF2533 family protein [Bacillaceae bacterium]|nr:DUF2533 family protein [Paenibacillus bovis]HLU21600.1 DUF2533 family protein [Bacillaceae bacterium]